MKHHRNSSAMNPNHHQTKSKSKKPYQQKKIYISKINNKLSLVWICTVNIKENYYVYYNLLLILSVFYFKPANDIDQYFILI